MLRIFILWGVHFPRTAAAEMWLLGAKRDSILVGNVLIRQHRVGVTRWWQWATTFSWLRMLRNPKSVICEDRKWLLCVTQREDEKSNLTIFAVFEEEKLHSTIIKEGERGSTDRREMMSGKHWVMGKEIKGKSTVKKSAHAK